MIKNIPDDFGSEHHHEHHKHRIGHKHDTGSSSIDYYAVHSGIRHWSAEFKVAFSIILLLICLIANNPIISAIVLCTSAVISMGFGKLPFNKYLSVMTIPIAFIILGSLAIAIDFSKNPIGDLNIYLHWGYMFITKDKVIRMLFLMLKVFAAVSAVFIMTLSTPSFELFSVLKKIHCPSLIVELMHMIYRFIFILMSVQRNMRISAESRLGFKDFKTSCYSFGQIAGNLFIISLKKANAYFSAMESRCYDGTFAFLEEDRKKQPKLAVIGGAYLLVLIILSVILKIR